jgi:hypothetical protein
MSSGIGFNLRSINISNINITNINQYNNIHVIWDWI